ncbi:DUF2169 family type VI secretion system accessory protein [Variovorax sp.]|uniref:DUF2169 family type VI secretion system accessory protein n=1 Tax=Variovorax sp. TaxID=1871043 RepID=UPI002D3B3D3D|nr:DUF2169 domain-containing protein [Variovorax sp.]HYP84229.1 DUF2169 domain-containing protein [Variovorax sp.]
MEIVNASGHTVGYTQGVEPSGREWLVVVAKGTFSLPAPDDPAGALAPRHPMQVPLVTADTFTGEPGFSAPRLEVDFALRKPRCDILLNGSAHAPDGEPVERVLVGARVTAGAQSWQKSMAVVGPRHWSSGLGGIRASPPQSFVRQPISYDVAFGGLDQRHEDPAEHAAYRRNPVGRGWHRHLQGRYVDGAPLPLTEQVDAPVSAPDGDHVPMAYGPVGRGWSSRLPYAGTYDQDWIDNTFPFLPADFQDAYYQAAPMDQQIAHPIDAASLEVTLVHLTGQPHVRFRLPCQGLPVSFFRRRGGHEQVTAVMDTLVIDTDAHWATVTWRAALPLRKSMLEISNVLVGTMSQGWWRARALGKTWHPSLGALVRNRGAEDAA